MDPKNSYTTMQQNHYDEMASKWSLDNREPVVGSFDKHNNWSDYETFLFKDIATKDKVALDFGCGPGRGIVQFSPLFARIDGTDISQVNLDNAKLWFEHSKLSFEPNLYKTNGVDLSAIKDEQYDVIYSTICLQHICVHEIRFNLFKEFYRVLKSSGSICIQMGCGRLNKPGGSGYYDNVYTATSTNGYGDVQISNSDQVKYDLEKIGFKNFKYDIRPTGPGDAHENWIYFRASKVII